MTAAPVVATASLHSVWDEVDGIRIHGRVSDRALTRERRADVGSVAIRDVVFVHGLGMSTRYLEPTMRLLTGSFAVSGLDLPGFGESRLRGRTLTLGELARVVDAWMRVRGIASPILVGQSHGCQVVVECAARAHASALVLNAPTMLAGHRSVLTQLGLVARDTPREPLSLVPHVASAYLRAGPRRILATLTDALRDRLEDKLPRIAVPTTIVCGQRDPVSPPAWSERLARLTGLESGGSGARFRPVEGAAHAVPFSHPAALAEEIVAIAARIRGTGPAS